MSGHSAEFVVLKLGEANTNKKDVKFQGFLCSHAAGFLQESLLVFNFSLLSYFLVRLKLTW